MRLAYRCGCLIASLVFGLAAQSASAGPAEDYIDAQLRVVRGLEEQLDGLADAADAAAARLLAGGTLYLAGERGMVEELASRAGGLCGAKPLSPKKLPAGLGANDVVLWSDYGLSQTGAEGDSPIFAPRKPGQSPGAAEAWTRLVESGALLIAFASAENPVLRGPLAKNVTPVALKLPADSRLVVRPDGQRLIPAAAPALSIGQWTYVAELIGACRRQRRQTAVYLSIFLDPDRQRYKRTAGLMFDPDLRPEPAPRKQLSGQFLATVRTSLEAVRREELANVRKAAGWLAEAAAAERQVIRNLQGHLPPNEVGLPGDVALFTNVKRLRASGPEAEAWVRENLHADDVYLLLGYQENEDALSAAANAQGARSIFITSKGPGPEQRRSPRHVYVDPHWPYTDACLELPGYDVKACPLSAIMGLTCYYAILGEAVGLKQ